MSRFIETVHVSKPSTEWMYKSCMSPQRHYNQTTYGILTIIYYSISKTHEFIVAKKFKHILFAVLFKNNELGLCPRN